MGVAVEGYGNNGLDWQGNKTWLNLAARMWMNSWDWKGLGLKDIPTHLYAALPQCNKDDVESPRCLTDQQEW